MIGGIAYIVMMLAAAAAIHVFALRRVRGRFGFALIALMWINCCIGVACVGDALMEMM